MKSIKTPTKRMRLWSFNLETALFALQIGKVDEAEKIIQTVIFEMEGEKGV